MIVGTAGKIRRRSGRQTMRKLRYVGSVMGEIFQFARQHKVYWIVPFVLILALVIVLVVTSQAAAPFIYTLF